MTVVQRRAEACGWIGIDSRTDMRMPHSSHPFGRTAGKKEAM